MTQASLPIRAGMHTGEIELRGDDVGGIAVHIAARIAALADVGEIIVSRTVKDLSIGSGLSLGGGRRIRTGPAERPTKRRRRTLARGAC
jgi:class 3 adenylate cyclase